MTNLSIRQVAEAMGVEKRSAERRAERECWQYTEASSRGGRQRRYDLHHLPADVQRQVAHWQAALQLRQASAAVDRHLPVLTGEPARAAPPLAALPAMPDALPPEGRAGDLASASAGGLSSEDAADGLARSGLYLDARGDDAAARLREAERRLAIIRPVLRKLIVGRDEITRHGASHGITAATIYRWIGRYRKGALQGLIDPPRRDRGQARVILAEGWERFARGAGLDMQQQLAIAGEMVGVVRGLWARQGMSSWRQVRELAWPVLTRLTAEAVGGDEHAVAAHCRLSRRFTEGERRYARVSVADRDGKGFYDRHIPAVRRTREMLQPGDVVFGDVSPADIPVLRPDGAIAWARLIAWQDAATNMLYITGHLAGKGASVRREHVALSFASMCASAPWGCPKRLYLDNGSEYSWTEMLDAWAELTRFTAGAFGGAWWQEAAEEFGVVTRSIPFKPRAKLIEGTFGNLLYLLAWHPGFAGSDRMRKKVATLGKGVEPTTIPDLKKFIAEAVAMYNGLPQRGHLADRSPAQAVATFLDGGYRPLHVESEALALAFSERHEAKVRAGQVRAGGWVYYAPVLHQYDGEPVLVRWPRHAPDAAYVFHRGQLIATALPTPVFSWGDPAGAKHAAKLAAEARRSVEIMRGQVSWLEPRDLMGEFARLANVSAVVDRAHGAARQIELSAEARAMLAARNAAAMAALGTAAKSTEAHQLKRFAIEPDEETEAVRAELGF